MSKSPPSRVVPFLWILGLGAAIAVPLLMLEPEAVSQHTPLPAHDDPAVAVLEQRVAALERQVALLALRLPTDGSDSEPLLLAEAGDVAGAGAVARPEVEARLARLEALEAERQDELLAEIAEEQADDIADQARDLARRDLAQSIILDPARTDVEKAAAWRELDDLEVDAWTDAVVLAMLDVARSQDPEIREDVWKGADADHTHRLLAGPLVSALTSDPEPKVREEAADALSRYLDEPGVRSALERAKDHDADMGVREEALKSLMDG